MVGDFCLNYESDLFVNIYILIFKFKFRMFLFGKYKFVIGKCFLIIVCDRDF